LSRKTTQDRLRKIVEEDDAGQIKTLFHGVQGSKVMKIGEWITADKKMVRDGTSNTWYLSGFHVLPSREKCEKYLTRFTKRLDRLRIVPCYVRGELRSKTHSRADVYLADEVCFLTT